MPMTLSLSPSNGLMNLEGRVLLLLLLGTALVGGMGGREAGLVERRLEGFKMLQSKTIASVGLKPKYSSLLSTSCLGCLAWEKLDTLQPAPEPLPPSATTARSAELECCQKRLHPTHILYKVKDLSD